MSFPQTETKRRAGMPLLYLLSFSYLCGRALLSPRSREMKKDNRNVPHSKRTETEFRSKLKIDFALPIRIVLWRGNQAGPHRVVSHIFKNSTEFRLTSDEPVIITFLPKVRHRALESPPTKSWERDSWLVGGTFLFVGGTFLSRLPSEPPCLYIPSSFSSPKPKFLLSLIGKPDGHGQA